VTGQGLWLF